MYSLVFDTSTERAIIALFQDEQLMSFEELPFGLTSSKHMLPMLDRMLKNHQITPKDLCWIATGVGPGSYTGMRVGAVIGKTLSYAAKIPLIGVCSLDSFVPKEDGTFAAMLDAKISGVYLKQGIKHEGKVVWKGEATVVPLDQVGEFPLVVTPHQALLEKKISAQAFEERSPYPQALMQVAKQKFESREYSLDGHLELLYLRKTQAEIEKEQVVKNMISKRAIDSAGHE